MDFDETDRDDADYILRQRERERFQADLLYVANSNMYINEKGYLQKLLDLLYQTGYYENNESYFIRLKG